MAVGPGVDVAVSSPTPIGHMDRVGWAGVAYSPKAPGWLVGVWTPWGDSEKQPDDSNDGRVQRPGGASEDKTAAYESWGA